jgi:hypothetical protein
MGRPNAITADMVRGGAIVIDVGINRVPDAREERQPWWATSMRGVAEGGNDHRCGRRGLTDDAAGNTVLAAAHRNKVRRQLACGT